MELLTAVLWHLQGCQSTAPAADLALPRAENEVQIQDRVPFIQRPLQGLLYEQIPSQPTATGQFGKDATPFVVLQLRSAPLSGAYQDYFSTPDRCWREVPIHELTGERDIGASVTLSVGADDLILRRDRTFTPGQTVYLYNPDTQRDVGRETGAELVFDGVATGVKVPPPIDWSGAAWGYLQETGLVVAEWEPSTETYIWLDLRFYDIDYEVTTFVCALSDDGYARIDPGVPKDSIQGIELFVERQSVGIVEHPSYGPLMVVSFRNIRLFQDHLLH